MNGIYELLIEAKGKWMGEKEEEEEGKKVNSQGRRGASTIYVVLVDSLEVQLLYSRRGKSDIMYTREEEEKEKGIRGVFKKLD